MRRFQIWAWRYIPGVHPGIESFILRADGEGLSELEEHLARCAQCRRHAELLQTAVRCAHEGERADAISTTPLLNETFRNVQLHMRAWCSLGGLTPGRQSAGRRRGHSGLSKAVEFYFGKETARRIECCPRWGAADHPLTAITNPLFKAFLGTIAADAVARQIATSTM